MEHKEQILFRKLLKKNGFVKSDTTDNKNLMEFIKNTIFDDDVMIVYTYDVVEVYFGTIDDCIVKNINEFCDFYLKHTGKNFNLK